VRSASETFFFDGSGGGRFGLRFSLAPNALTALRPGDGPRAFGFSILILLVVQAFVSVAHTYQFPPPAQARRHKFRLTGAVLFPR